MSSITDIEAMDEINDVVFTAWTANIAAIVGSSSSELRFESFEKGAVPDRKFTAIVLQQIVTQDLASFSDENTLTSKRRYETKGLVFGQVFAPKSIKNAYKTGLKVGGLIRDAFRAWGSQGDVWFQNARVTKVTDDLESYRFNVIADYSYDTIR